MRYWRDIDDETHVVVPRKLSAAQAREMQGAMPVEFRYWTENGRLHAEFMKPDECVQPQSVWDAVIAAVEGKAK